MTCARNLAQQVDDFVRRREGHSGRRLIQEDEDGVQGKGKTDLQSALIAI